jgi:hypothetical protein
MLGNFLVAAQLVASQEGLNSMELVSYLQYYHDSTFCHVECSEFPAVLTCLLYDLCELMFILSHSH